MARSILVLAMAVAAASVGIEQVHALVAGQVTPASITTTDNSAEIVSLAASMRTAALTSGAATPAAAAPASTTEETVSPRRQAISNSIQEVVVTAGASPIKVLSAIYAFRNCAGGAATSTTGVTMRAGLATVTCKPEQVETLDEDTLAVLSNLETIVIALLDGEQPAALGAGFFSGLSIPSSGGPSGGGTDYIG